MQGPDVKELQKELNAKHWLRGAIDGEYGPITSQGVWRAKYWLGYKNPLSPDWYNAGELLMNYLTGRVLTTPEMKAVVKKRLSGRPQQTVGLKMLGESKKYIGVKESPAGSNIVIFSKWYNIGPGPWCAMFLSFCAFKIGHDKFHYAYVPYVVQDAFRHHNNLSAVGKTAAVPGDLVCYDWDGDGVADHIGIVESKPDGNGNFHAIEGNTSLGNDSNGGEVMRRVDRYTRNVQCFVHISS